MAVLTRKIKALKECSQFDFLWHQAIKHSVALRSLFIVPSSLHLCMPVYIHSTNILFSTANLGSLCTQLLSRLNPSENGLGGKLGA